jgi:hypothetical protein
MPSEIPLVQIDLSPEYKQNLRNLSKRCRNIRSDTQDVFEQIQAGNFVGDRGGITLLLDVHKSFVSMKNYSTKY